MALDADSFYKHTDKWFTSLNARIMEQIGPLSRLVAACTRVKLLLTTATVLIARDAQVLAAVLQRSDWALF